MANIFKTTLKKEVIADIANNNVKEIRFPLTKFWATRLTDEYNLDDKTFKFRKYDSLELSSPSNKDTNGMTFVFDHVKTFVDGDEFVVEFKQTEDVSEDDCQIEDNQQVDNVQPVNVDVVVEDMQENSELQEVKQDQDGDIDDEHSGVYFEKEIIIEDCDLDVDDSDIDFDDEIPFIDNDVVFESVKQLFDETTILDILYDSEDVIATNARQVIVLPNGKILGSNKVLPVNNDAEVRIEFDMNEKVYFDATFGFDSFEEDIYKTLVEIRKNNFLFVWKRYTGIFMDNEGGIYFGIKYSTRKSIGFKRKYNVQ
jgi:hypothetical protein